MIPIEFWIQPLFSSQQELHFRILSFGLVLSFISIVTYIVAPCRARTVSVLVHVQAFLFGSVILWPGEYYLSDWQYWERAMIIQLFLGGLLFWILSISIFIGVGVSRKSPKKLRWKAALGLLGAFAIGVAAKHILALLTWQ